MPYPEQIGCYDASLAKKWDEAKYFENDISVLPYYYYEGTSGKCGLRLCGSGQRRSLGTDHRRDFGCLADPAVSDIWTLVDGELVMLAQGDSGLLVSAIKVSVIVFPVFFAANALLSIRIIKEEIQRKNGCK